MLKNDLLIRALAGQSVERPPVWMMRQAGRYLPDFRKLKAKYDFFDRIRNPEMACEITVMPVRQVGVDAAILFSDILVIPQAMGVDVKMIENKGPVISDPIRSRKQVDELLTDEIVSRLDYVLKAIKLTLSDLNNEVPLIGFAGAPWTIFCYMIQGRGDKTFDMAISLCKSDPATAHLLLDKITNVTIDYLNAKVDAGVHALQLFDSWAGLLAPADYIEFSHTYNRKIIQALRVRIPVILFARERASEIDRLSDTGASAFGIDWNIEPKKARQLAGKLTLQGNLDPKILLEDEHKIQSATRKMIEEFGVQNYIANLGHGILPETPVKNAIAFVETVKSYRSGSL